MSRVAETPRILPLDYDDAEFWSLVDHISDESSCWGWKGNTSRGGYGVIRIKVDGRPLSFAAHRVAYELCGRSIPDGHEVHHACQRRDCVRPLHLVALSVAEHRHVHAFGGGMPKAAIAPGLLFAEVTGIDEAICFGERVARMRAELDEELAA